MVRPRKRPATPLSAFLDRILKRNGLTHNEFSRQVGMSPASVSDLKLRDEAPSPGWDLVHTWAKVLQLRPEEEVELRDLMELAHSTRYVQNLVADLRQQVGGRVAEGDPESEGRNL